MAKRKLTKKQQQYVKKVSIDLHLSTFLAVAKQADIDEYFRNGYIAKEK